MNRRTSLPRKVRLELQRRDALNRQAAVVHIHERGAALRNGHSHRGYIIGIHWLAAAYERICAGEPEVEVLADFGYTYTPPKAWPPA